MQANMMRDDKRRMRLNKCHKAIYKNRDAYGDADERRRRGH